MNIQPIKISSKVINSNQFIHAPNQFIQDMGPLAFEGQFDLTEYLRQFIQQYLEENDISSQSITNSNSYVITGTIFEAIALSIFIPGGTFEQGDVIKALWRCTKSNTNGTTSIRLSVNSTLSLTGTTTLSYITPISATDTFIQQERVLFIKNATTDTQTISNIQTVSSDILTTSSGASGAAINWSTDKYIMLSIQLGSALDFVASQFLQLTVSKP
jgi:hypothetical protein